jgi:hypothetical protein
VRIGDRVPTGPRPQPRAGLPLRRHRCQGEPFLACAATRHAHPFLLLLLQVSSILSASATYNPQSINLQNLPSPDLLPDLADLYPKKKPMVMARMGPTTDDQPVFCWKRFDDLQDAHSQYNKRGHGFYHLGHPACFDFQWQALPPLPAANVIPAAATTAAAAGGR